MPSMEESKRTVMAGLAERGGDVNHDAILASLQDEIDKHNEIKRDTKRSMRSSRRDRRRSASPSGSSRPMRFRFKDGTSDLRKHKHRSREHSRKRKRVDGGDKSEKLEGETIAHPFPREPTSSDRHDGDSKTAFRESLFDALADDEGAAYWEGVYSQPIHIYNRPSVQNENGELEQMDDEEYAAYVQTKMWERKHPEIVQQREKRNRERLLDEEERARRREEFVRKKERAAWERAQGWKGSDSDDGAYHRRSRRNRSHDYEFTGNENKTASRHEQESEYAAAWADYLKAWDTLKRSLIESQSESAPPTDSSNLEKAAHLPWPVLSHKSVTKANIEDFMLNAPSDAEHSRLRILKTERVRWHPDKVQQRFGGKVDEKTMRVVTGVFQVVDALFEVERRHTDRS